MKKTIAAAVPSVVSLGENPVNAFHAREYARESSPGILAVLLELTENARDNATEVTLTIEVGSSRTDGAIHVLAPTKIICQDNGTGLTHAEFLNKFCGAYSESESHHDVDRAGRNGVGTKTYTSIAARIIVNTTTGRPTEGLDRDRDALIPHFGGVGLPRDGEPDVLWRAYEFCLHTRGAIPEQWKAADPNEMGTIVELCDLQNGTEIPYEVLIERLSYNREWLQSGSHGLAVQLVGNVPTDIGRSKKLSIRPWAHPVRNWLTEACGRSDQSVTIFNPTTKETETIPQAAQNLGVLDFDFRVVGRGSDNQMQTLEKPALLLEICGALPYPPNLEGVISTRTLPLLTFVGLEHASSIGAFCNTICGYARINSLLLKQALRNNKNTLASGPGAESVDVLREYLKCVLTHLHRAWYDATRSSQDQAVSDAVKEAEQEINLALKGVNPSSSKDGDIIQSGQDNKKKTAIPARRHRWECGSCGRRWLAAAGFNPKICAEVSVGSGKGHGCGSTNIGLAKNQPQIADCRIRIEQLGDRKLPANFQFEKQGEDVELPVVFVNQASPRYIELRGTTSISGQAQSRLKQYLVDVSLVAIASFYSEAAKTDFAEEWGKLYFNRMLRNTGIKKYEAQLAKVLQSTTAEKDQNALSAA